MVRKFFIAGFAFAALAGLLLPQGAARADGYRADEFFHLDLNRAALSPNPLGPPAQFEPVPVGARAEATRPQPAARVAHAPAAKPPAAPRRKLARVRSSPLDAMASDTRIQVRPCRSGGICNWSKPAR